MPVTRNVARADAATDVVGGGVQAPRVHPSATVGCPAVEAVHRSGKVACPAVEAPLVHRSKNSAGGSWFAHAGR